MDNLRLLLVLSYCCTLCYCNPAIILTPRKLDDLGASVTFNSQNGLGAYDYGYREGHATGESFRRESGDAFGNKVGSYGLKDADGRERIVRYVADENGYRADVTSNEPGVAPADPASATFNKPQIVPAPVVPVAPVVAAYPPPPPPVAYAKPLPPPQYFNSYNDPPPSYYPPPPAAKAYGPPPPPPAQLNSIPKGGYYGPPPPAPVAVAPKVGFYAPPPPPPPVAAAPKFGFYAPPVVAPVAVAPKFGFYAPPPPPPPVAVAPKVGFYAPPPVAVAPVVKAAPVGFAALAPPPAAYLGNVVQTKGYVGAIRTLPSFVPPFAAFGYLNAKPSFQALGYPL